MKWIKMFEGFDDNLYSQVDIDFFSGDIPNWNYEMSDIKKLIKEFNTGWTFFIKQCDLPFKKDKYELLIVTENTTLEWLCWDKNERKRFNKVDNPQEYNISDILITGSGIKGYQIHDYDDEYFKCMINDIWGNTEELYKCDTIDGVIKLLKDKKVI